VLTTSDDSKSVKLFAQMLHPSAISWRVIIYFTIRIKIVIRKVISALLKLLSSACIYEVGFSQTDECTHLVSPAHTTLLAVSKPHRLQSTVRAQSKSWF